MEAKSYFRSHGKITMAIHLPVDGALKKVETEAKAKNFDFNAWARDVLNSRINEVIKACSLKVER
jgi:hypothetical protein